MKRVAVYIAVAGALLPFAFGQSPSQQQSGNSNSEQKVRQMIDKYRTALLQRDIPALEKIWAEDYVFVNASGELMTKAQRLASLKSGATSFESIKNEENLTVRVYQNSAVATSRATINGQYNGKPAMGQYRSTHVWVKGPTGWQLVSNQLTALAAR